MPFFYGYLFIVSTPFSIKQKTHPSNLLNTLMHFLFDWKGSRDNEQVSFYRCGFLNRFFGWMPFRTPLYSVGEFHWCFIALLYLTLFLFFSWKANYSAKSWKPNKQATQRTSRKILSRTINSIQRAQTQIWYFTTCETWVCGLIFLTRVYF